MNEKTLVAVMGYGPSKHGSDTWDYKNGGDVERIRMLLPTHEAHGCPIVIFSPTDAPIKEMGPHICRQAGKRAYTGQASLDRQRDHMRILLEYPFDWFLLNDSDSCCITPQIPLIFYQQGFFFSNEITEPRPHESPYPKIAMHPPYFMHRGILERMLSVADRIVSHPITPFIDHYMLQLVCESGVPHDNFLDYATDRRVMLHPVKTADDIIACQCIGNPKG